MARRVLSYTVDNEGRDKGKVFVLTEMPASKAEKWAIKAVSAMVAAGVDVPDGIDLQGMAGLAQVGISAFSKIPFEQAEPLLDEMFECIEIAPDAKNRSVVRRLVEDDIEDVATRFKLRMELFKLHLGFFDSAA